MSLNKCKECGDMDCKAAHNLNKRKMELIDNDPNFRLALLNSGTGDGVMIGLVHRDREEGSFAHLPWESALELADRIYAKYKKAMSNE